MGQAARCALTLETLCPTLMEPNGSPESGHLAEPGIGMLVQKVTQRRDKLPSMRNIMVSNSHADVIDHHVSDLFGTVLGLEQGEAEHGGDGIRDVLVLGNSVDLFRREVREPDQVYKRDHGCLRRCDLSEE